MTLVSRDAARGVVELLGAGRSRGRAGGRRQPGAATSPTRSRPPARRDAGNPRRASCAPRRRTRSSDLERARGALRRRPPRARSRSGSRAATARGGSSTPAVPQPAGASSASCARSSPSTSASRCSRAAASTAILAEDGRCVGVQAARRRARSSRGRDGARDRRRGRAVVAHHQPAGATGGGLLLAYDAGAALADLELMQFHPTAVAAANGADGFLVTEAVRGEGATLLDARRRAVRRRAGARATRSRARSSSGWRDRRALGRPRHARRRPGAVPERRQRAARRPASTPSASWSRSRRRRTT